MIGPILGAGSGVRRIAILATVRLYREGLVRALKEFNELAIVGAEPVGQTGLDMVITATPHVVLVEAAAACDPELVRFIVSHAPGARVIAYAIGDEECEAIRYIEAGVAGFVSGDASVEDLVSTILRVADGELPCSPRLAALLAQRISHLATGRGTNELASSLTVREREILHLIDEGLSNKEIARRLGIEVSTVKNHVHHILEKTHASRRTQAAARVRNPTIASAPIPPLPSVKRPGIARR